MLLLTLCLIPFVSAPYKGPTRVLEQGRRVCVLSAVERQPAHSISAAPELTWKQDTKGKQQHNTALREKKKTLDSPTPTFMCAVTFSLLLNTFFLLFFYSSNLPVSSTGFWFFFWSSSSSTSFVSSSSSCHRHTILPNFQESLARFLVLSVFFLLLAPVY